MSLKPSIHGLKLPTCCQEAMQQIRDKQESGRLLQGAILAAPFVLLFGSGPLDMVFDIATGDWDGVTKAARTVPSIVRDRCKTIAQFQAFDHPGGELNHFWAAMADSFT